MGPLISTVPCRVQFNDKASLRTQISGVYSDRIATMAHSHARLADMVRWGGTQGELFDTLLVYQNLPEETTPDGRLAFDVVEVSSPDFVGVDYSLRLIVEQSPTKLVLAASTNSATRAAGCPAPAALRLERRVA